MKEITTPAIENVKMHDASFTAYADMTLASIPCTISGQYNAHSNSFYPSAISFGTKSVPTEYQNVRSMDLEEFCDQMDWDYDETYYQIQNVVEGRDR